METINWILGKKIIDTTFKESKYHFVKTKLDHIF